MSIKGLDVSRFQGEVDWERVKAAVISLPCSAPDTGTVPSMSSSAAMPPRTRDLVGLPRGRLLVLLRRHGGKCSAGSGQLHPDRI